MGVQKEAPGWFAKALETPYEEGAITVDGARIHYLQWGGVSDKPGIVLVHGNGAHAHWWTFIAPFLLEHYRVVALDLSGMGDSDHRERYSPEGFAAEVVGVMDAAGVRRRFDRRRPQLRRIRHAEHGPQVSRPAGRHRAGRFGGAAAGLSMGARSAAFAGPAETRVQRLR